MAEFDITNIKKIINISLNKDTKQLRYEFETCGGANIVHEVKNTAEDNKFFKDETISKLLQEPKLGIPDRFQTHEDLSKFMKDTFNKKHKLTMKIEIDQDIPPTSAFFIIQSSYITGIPGQSLAEFAIYPYVRGFIVVEEEKIPDISEVTLLSLH